MVTSAASLICGQRAVDIRVRGLYWTNDAFVSGTLQAGVKLA
jgi:hypothetical protein